MGLFRINLFTQPFTFFFLHRSITISSVTATWVGHASMTKPYCYYTHFGFKSIPVDVFALE